MENLKRKRARIFDLPRRGDERTGTFDKKQPVTGSNLIFKKISQSGSSLLASAALSDVPSFFFI